MEEIPNNAYSRHFRGKLLQRWRELILTYLRTVILYLVLILAVRLMGKREVGQMEPTEFVVAMLIADLASIPMQDLGIPLYAGLVPIFTVLGLELVLAVLAMRSMKLRRLMCGKPVILIEDGKILQNNLRKTRVTLDELMGHLREKDVLDLTTVQYAILETNGNLSVFPYPKYNPPSAKDAGVQAGKQYLPVTLIEDGQLLADNLEKAQKNAAWVQQTLREKGSSLAQTWLLMVDRGGRVVWLPKEEGK